MSLVHLFGWISSGLIVWSLTQARVLRFRWINLAGASLAVVVNGALGVWPFATMNLIITGIDTYWIVRLTRQRHDARAYSVVEVGIEDAYMRHLLAQKAEDLARTHPSFQAPGRAAEGSGSRSAFVVLHGDETVGMVVVRDVGQGVGEIELDYVTHRFRDFTPGEFVYRASGIFEGKGFDRLRLVDDVAAEHDYYQTVGFSKVGGRWERPVEVGA